jgi:hypothetical protein
MRFGTAPLSDADLASLTAVLEQYRRGAGDFD